jgi:uncharacterized membrane protein
LDPFICQVKLDIQDKSKQGSTMRFGRIFYIFVLVICGFEMLRIWSIAPNQMAAHFNITGNPDRFVPKAEFFWFQIQTLLMVFLMSIPLQALFLFLPTNLINMPNRDYWLAPERRAKTMDTLSSFGATLFGVILLVVQAAFEISVYANLQTPIFFNARLMSTIMIISLIIIGLMLIQLMVYFRLPKSSR